MGQWQFLLIVVHVYFLVIYACVICARIFPLCLDDELGYVHIKAVLKKKRCCMFKNGDGGHQTGMFIAGSCQTVWLGSIEVAGCWAFVMVEIQALALSSGWS